VTESPGSTAAVPTGRATRVDTGSEPTTAALLSQLSQQSTDLIRGELRLAQAELIEKIKHAGKGGGLFGGAGVVALYGAGALVATAILALALVLPAWLAALVVAVVLLAVAGVLALLGKKEVAQGTPVAPEQTIDNLKRDVAAVKEARS